jgi:hypothetical protein
MSKGIGIALETSQVYLPRDVQEWLRIQSWRIPYKNIQLQEFTIEDNQWNAAATAAVTNFHLPKSSLLMLVSALIGRENVLEIYRTAVEKKYRFFSYGDGMLILRSKK